MRRRSVIVLLTGGLGLLAALARNSSEPGSWPENNDSATLKFSHAYHVSEAGIACTDCHKTDTTRTQALENLRSTHDNCATCHAEQIASNCGYCHKDTLNIQAAPQPQHTIIFAHVRHMAMNNMQCVVCHSGLDRTEYAGPTNMPLMTTCTTCHNNEKATNTCEACHTSFTNLIPPDHRASDFRKEHRQLTRLGALEVSCSTCHTQNFCADCHGAAPLMQFGRSGLMTEPSPRNSSGKDSPKQMTLQMVHSMNYRYTHAIEAKSKASDCYSCHSAQQFCAECHAVGDNLTPGAKPAWHLGANFTTLGRGSGGGRHADFARRDIESCVSCHDVRGRDPVCITCHTDADGIRGTDPRTHPAGFAQDEGMGSWHRDAGASCYNCHTDMNASPNGVAGKSFCGYCHGPKK